MDKVVFGLFGAFITVFIFTLTNTFRAGHIVARIEELEKWRSSIRVDMHEISDKIESMTAAMEKLTTLIEERTERRNFSTRTP
jgi:hypothetical protein